MLPHSIRCWFQERFPFFAERFLVGVIVFFLFVPLAVWTKTAATAAFAKTSPNSQTPIEWMRSFPNVEELKKQIMTQANEGFWCRQELIRLTNQIWFRCFRVCPAKSAGVTIAKDDWLFETAYLQEYCIDRVPKESMVSLVEDLKRFQAVCDQAGIKFAVLITPSKASIFPEYIPAEWKKRCDARPRAYDIFVPLLKSNGIRFVDGHELTAVAKANALTPIFPKGGTHWDHYGALVTTNGLLENLRNQGLAVSKLETTEIRPAREVTGMDGDLMGVMNLWKPFKYPTSEFQICPPKAPGTRGGNICLVGGSFTWAVAGALADSGQFSEVEMFYYYKVNKSVNPTFKPTLNVVREPTGKVDFEHEVFASDCIVLEVNEQRLTDPRHMKVFLQDAFASLENGAAKRGAFVYEGAIPYEVGKVLSFRSDAPGSPQRSWLRGFSTAEATGTWTDSKDSSISLLIPETTEDLTLKANLYAFVYKKKLREQVVDISANGVPLGQWRLNSGQPTTRELTIPKKCLTAGPLLVLRLATPTARSPQSLNILDDQRELGVFISDLCLNKANPASSEGVARQSAASE